MIRKTLITNTHGRPDVPEIPSLPGLVRRLGPVQSIHTHPSHAPYILGLGQGLVAGVQMMKLHQQQLNESTVTGETETPVFPLSPCAHDVCFATRRPRVLYLGSKSPTPFTDPATDIDAALTTRERAINGPGSDKCPGAEHANGSGTKWSIGSTHGLRENNLHSRRIINQVPQNSMHSAPQSAFLGPILLPSWMEHSFIVTYRLAWVLVAGEKWKVRLCGKEIVGGRKHGYDCDDDD
jgi:hypothetical protein